MKVYIVSHYIEYEYDNIEKVFSSREKAEEYQELMREKYHCPRYYKSYNITEDFYVDEYEVESSADRPQGEWIRDRYWSRGIGMGEEYGFFYKCSLCEYEVENGYTRCGFNFCPYCGADMRKESE